MALVNPGIAMSFRQPDIQAPNALAQFAQIQQIQGGRQAQELAQYQLGAAQRAEATQNALANAYSQSVDPATGKINYNKLTGLLASGGGGSQIPGIEKTRRETEAAQTEGQIKQTKLLADKLALLPEAYRMADTPEAYLAVHQSVHADPVVGSWLKSVGATPEKGLAALQNAVQTGKFDEFRAASMQSVGQILEGMKPVTVAASSSVYNPRTGAFTQAPAAPAAPTQLAKLQTERAALPPGDPRIAQYDALIRKEITPAAGTTINMVSERAEQGARGKMLVDQYGDISKAAGLAARTLPAIEANLSALNKGFDTGFGKETVAAGASVLAALGVKDAEKFATDTQKFQSNAISAVLQKQLEQKGPQTESDAKRIEQIGAQLGKTKNANEFILATAKEQLKRDVDQRNFYDRWYKTNKTYDGAEDAWFSGEGGKSLFDRPGLKKYDVSAAGAASQIPTAATPTRAAPAAAPIYARNPQTNQRIMSTDGGNTWTPAR